MRVLVTRPRLDADTTVVELAARGHTHVVAPLFAVTFYTDKVVNLDGVQAILITSANGVRALTKVTDRREFPIMAVGTASASVARDSGFNNVISAGGDVEALAELVAALLSPTDGPLLHVAGSVIARGLAERLGATGFTLNRVVIYNAEPVKQIPSAMEDALRSGTLDAALFYSPRSAAQFVRLLKRAKLTDACGNMLAVALSQPVADKLTPVRFSEVRVAAKPDQTSLLEVLDAVS